MNVVVRTRDKFMYALQYLGGGVDERVWADQRYGLCNIQGVLPKVVLSS